MTVGRITYWYMARRKNPAAFEKSRREREKKKKRNEKIERRQTRTDGEGEPEPDDPIDGLFPAEMLDESEDPEEDPDDPSAAPEA